LGLKPESGGEGGDSGGGRLSKRQARKRAEANAEELRRDGESNVVITHDKERRRYTVSYDRKPTEVVEIEGQSPPVIVEGKDGGVVSYEPLGALIWGGIKARLTNFFNGAIKMVEKSPVGISVSDARAGNYEYIPFNFIPPVYIYRQREMVGEATVSMVTSPLQGIVLAGYLYYGNYYDASQLYTTHLANGASAWVGMKLGGVGNPKANTTGTLAETAAPSIESAFAKTSTNLLKPLGLGSTGRTTAGNLVEQMAMEDVMANPNLGKIVMEGMKDSRWLGWSKMQYTVTSQNGVKAVIYYVGKF